MKSKFIYFLILLSYIFSLDLNQAESRYKNKADFQSINQNQNNINKFLSDNIIHSSINPIEYVVGPGDIFLFNMIIPNRIVNIELFISPTSSILIPGIGTIDVQGSTLEETYKKIISVCKKMHEDAYVYVNISKLRKFKILIAGDTNYSGMHIVSASERVSDLIERIYMPSAFDSVLTNIYPEYSSNAMLNKDLFIERNDSIISIDLFDYFYSGSFKKNPTFIEGDKLIIKKSNTVTILGEIQNPSRVINNQSITYNDLIKLSDGLTANAEKGNILILNRNFFNQHNMNRKNISKNLYASIYSSDLDESYLKSRMNMLEGVIKFNDINTLELFLDSKISQNDIIIVPPKVDFIEIIGGITNPGAYKFEDNKFLYDYLFDAGGLADNANKNNYYLIDMIKGTKTKVSSNYKLKRGDIIFVEYNVGFKRWDRIKDSVDLVSRISTTLLVLYNFWSVTND